VRSFRLCSIVLGLRSFRLCSVVLGVKRNNGI
jgi:hypothetical protein